jgi:diguanylate cyclase (GGDEF)-like protein
LLKTVAKKLLAQVRQSDTVARLGGDEFVIQLRNPASKDEVAQIAERIIGTIKQPMQCRGQEVQVGASIGIALFPFDGNGSIELMQNADTAMYVAKSAGKNTFRFF